MINHGVGLPTLILRADVPVGTAFKGTTLGIKILANGGFLGWSLAGLVGRRLPFPEAGGSQVGCITPPFKFVLGLDVSILVIIV